MVFRMGEPNRRVRAVEDGRSRLLTTGEIAWMAVLPWTAVTVAAILLLGPPLGHLLFSPGHDRLWPLEWWETMGRREPDKHGRALIATLAPLILAAGVVAGSRARVSLPPRAVRATVTLAATTVVALAAVSLHEQNPLLLPAYPASVIFDLGSVLAAVAIAAACAVVLHRRPAMALIARAARETKPKRAVCFAAAIAFVGARLLETVVTDDQVGQSGGYNLPWTFDDAIAVLDGSTPLVDYHVIYAKLLPYLTAGVLGAFGTTILVYTLFMAILNGLALTAVYATFRRLTRSSLLSLGLFLPFVAASDVDPGNNPGLQSPMTLSAMWPMRYAGPYLLAWLTVRCLDGRSPRRPWPIFFVGGLAAINNLEFGTGAVLATVAALLCSRPPQSGRGAMPLLANAAGGLLGAGALVAVMTVVRAGALPDPSLLLEWPRIFTDLGWFSMPLPVWDLHLAIYATFIGAFALAIVRTVAPRADDVVLTGMLAWSGVFGLLASSYYVGRPDVFKLTGLMSAWSFALAMLTIVSVRAFARGGRPAIAHLLVLFGFALTVVLLPRMPLPQDEIRRLAASYPAAAYLPTVERVVRAHTRPGEKVTILVPMGHRVAHDLGLRNVTPYSFMNAIVTRSQFRTLLDVLRREDVRTVFTPAPGSILLKEGEAAPQQLEQLGTAGYTLTDSAPGLLVFRRR
jgi:hypothetical protein